MESLRTLISVIALALPLLLDLVELAELLEGRADAAAVPEPVRAGGLLVHEDAAKSVRRR